jgi:hypothetical protein
VLVAIDPDRDNVIETVSLQRPEDVTGFVQRWNGKRNLYYSVNPTSRLIQSDCRV